MTAGWIRLMAVGAVLGGLLALSVWQRRTGAKTAGEGGQVLLIAHPFLEDSVQRAFAEAGERFEGLQRTNGRRVRLKQVIVPPAMYEQWLRAQLIGGQAPALVYTGNTNGFDLDLTARYFRPMSQTINQRNPHGGDVVAGADTNVVGHIPWRDTFLDGLALAGFSFRLGEHYGIPLSMNTTRFALNVRLLSEVLANPAESRLRASLPPDGLPRTFDQMLALFQAVERMPSRRGNKVVAIAGYMANDRSEVLERLFGSQTQQLIFDWDVDATYRSWQHQTYLQLLEGSVRIDNPAFRAGLELQRVVGRLMHPGFESMRMQDALFYFGQERALAIPIAAEHFPSLLATVGDRIPLKVVDLPVPGPDSPWRGEHALGEVSEANVSPSTTFSVVDTHSAEVTALAVDFLMFLTTAGENERFAATARWLPCVVGARVPASLQAFEPQLEGLPAGPPLDFSDREMRRIIAVNLHRLFRADGGVDEFLAAVEPAYRVQARQSLRQIRNAYVRNGVLQNSLLAGFFWVGQGGSDSEREVAARQAGVILDTQVEREGHARQIDQRLSRICEAP